MPLGKLSRLAAQLPRTSRYQAALHADDEMAAKRLELEGDSDSTAASVPLQDWSPEVERLTLIADLISALRADFIAVNSKNNKRPKLEPLPRPRTAMERAQKQSVRQLHEDITAQVLPHKKTKG